MEAFLLLRPRTDVSTG